MTGTDAAHDAHDTHDVHGVHPISATIVLLVLVAFFSWAFALMNGATFSGVNAAIAGLLTLFGLVWIWVLDRP
jgi:drug/metabolite transporter superfamily protein YnfA